MAWGGNAGVVRDELLQMNGVADRAQVASAALLEKEPFELLHPESAPRLISESDFRDFCTQVDLKQQVLPSAELSRDLFGGDINLEVTSPQRNQPWDESQEINLGRKFSGRKFSAETS